MKPDRRPAVSHDGDTVRIEGRPVRMEFMVRDAFWSGDRAVVLLDPEAYMDDPSFGAQRRSSRKPVHNLRAYAPSGEMLWEAEQPELEDHYYRIESREPLIALSFSGFRCEIDRASGSIREKTRLK